MLPAFRGLTVEKSLLHSATTQGDLSAMAWFQKLTCANRRGDTGSRYFGEATAIERSNQQIRFEPRQERIDQRTKKNL
jgi:hypothetical protein